MSRALILAAVALALGTTFATRPDPPPAGAQVRLVSGTLAMSNSSEGGAIVTAAGMAPGDTAVGDVTISDTGDLAGTYSLSQSDLADTPGPAGGALSGALDVLVQDVTNIAAPATVYSGKLAAMGPRALGTWAPGAARTYRFTVSLPDGGAPPSATTGDNAYQGSAVTVRYDWTATADGPGGGRPGAHELTLTGKKRQRVLRQKGLVVFARCSEACSISARAKGRKAARKVTLKAWKGQAKPGARVKIKLRLSKKAMKSAKRSLKRGRRATMTVIVRAATGAGASTVRRLKVSVR